MKYISMIAILFATTAYADVSIKGNVVDYYDNVVVSTPRENEFVKNIKYLSMDNKVL
jgi:predicted small integral membrane protein